MADDYESNEWECPKCTYINQKQNKSCIICEYQGVIKPRIKTGKSEIEIFKIWQTFTYFKI